MQTPAIDTELLASDWPKRAEIGAVLIVVGLTLVPLAVLAVRRIFPGRNIVFARWGFSHVVTAVVFGAALVWLSGQLWPANPQAIDIQVELVRVALILSAVVALIARYAQRLDPEGWRSLGIWRGHQTRAVAAGWTAYFLSLPVLVGVGLVWPWFLQWIGEGFEPQALLESFRTLPREDIPLVLVLGIGVQPLLEEILFRAFLQPLLVQNFSEKGGVVLTSFLFAMMHGESQFGPVFALSLVLGAVMLRTQRLAGVWAVHALHNALVFGIMIVTERATDGASHTGLLAFLGGFTP